MLGIVCELVVLWPIVDDELVVLWPIVDDVDDVVVCTTDVELRGDLVVELKLCGPGGAGAIGVGALVVP